MLTPSLGDRQRQGETVLPVHQALGSRSEEREGGKLRARAFDPLHPSRRSETSGMETPATGTGGATS